MKTQITFIVTILAFSFMASANTNDRMIVKIEKTGADKTIKLQLANLENKRTNISLYDTNGVGWFFETVNKKNGYAKNLNLTGMPTGDYILSIWRKDQRHEQVMTVGEEGLVFFQTPEASHYQTGYAMVASNPAKVKGSLTTHFTKEEQQLGVQLANLQRQPASIQLISPQGGILLSRKVTDEIGYAKKWNLKSLKTGAYFLYVQSVDATVIQFFILEEDGIALTSTHRLENLERVNQPVFSKQ